MIRRTLLAGLLAAITVSGCSFSPVYVDGSPINAMSLAFNFAKPNSRLEQVAYQEIALRFASSSAPRTPDMVLSVSTRALGGVMAKPTPGVPGNAHVEATVTAVVTYEGKEIFKAVRRASAQYQQSGQVMADKAAIIDAEERATVAASESLRLAILATFPKSGSYL